LRAPLKDGTTAGQHLEGLAARGHKKALEKLEGPTFPEALEYLWDWFQDLDSSRHTTPEGPEPLTYQEILAWAQLTGSRTTPEEVRALRLLDKAYLNPPPETKEDEA
jgi:hypothetical protein